MLVAKNVIIKLGKVQPEKSDICLIPVAIVWNDPEISKKIKKTTYGIK